MSPLDELLDYVGFDEVDRRRLAELHPVIAPHFPEIAERFYAAVLRTRAATVLSGSHQVDHLKVTLIDWMSSGLTGPHDEHFYEKRSRIGRRHVQIGLAHHYMFTAMTVVRVAYLEHITAAYPAEQVAQVLGSVEKLLDIELAIMAGHYHIDSEDKVLARERRAQAARISAMQTMTAGIAHEVRNPLNSAQLQLELLERRLKRHTTDEKLLDPCELAQREIERLTRLLDDFLVFARPPDLTLDDCDVTELVRTVVEIERITADQRGVVLTFEAKPVQRARLDPGKLRQLVLNLLRNATEAVAIGGHVTVSVDGDDRVVRIVVSDDGPGIPEPIQSRIYEPFFSTKSGGSGLGMSIVHSLVALHGGAIDLTSSTAGTRFEISIPRRL